MKEAPRRERGVSVPIPDEAAPPQPRQLAGFVLRFVALVFKNVCQLGFDSAGQSLGMHPAFGIACAFGGTAFYNERLDEFGV